MDDRKRPPINTPTNDTYDGSFRAVMKNALGSLFGVLVVLAIAVLLFGR